MTAAEATRLTVEALAVDKGQLKIILDCWYVAIERAAKRGVRTVRDSDVPKPRMQISPAVRNAALDKLIGDGFVVQTGYDNSIQVSW
jgi:hypothetical protein